MFVSLSGAFPALEPLIFLLSGTILGAPYGGHNRARGFNLRGSLSQLGERQVGVVGVVVLDRTKGETLVGVATKMGFWCGYIDCLVGHVEV